MTIHIFVCNYCNSEIPKMFRYHSRYFCNNRCREEYRIARAGQKKVKYRKIRQIKYTCGCKEGQ